MPESERPYPHDEPVFEAEQPVVEEPYFAPVTESPRAPVFVEPVFDAVPAQARGVTLPVDSVHGQVGWETPALEKNAISNPDRRLGRATPLWVGVSVLAVVALVALWFSLSNRTPDEPLLPTVPAAGVVGSALLADAGVQVSAPGATAPSVIATPDARLSPGMHVAVGNTNGQGIRLRSTPGTGALTLGIYNDGAPFLVLSPGGDYSDYPVEVDGYFWYRIRVVDDPADQLVGWAAGDFLVNSNQ